MFVPSVRLPLVCVIATEVLKLLTVTVPVRTVIPPTVTVLLLKLIVPLVKVTVLVPIFRLSLSVNVAVDAALPNVIGKSNNLPVVVIDMLPDVAPNVVAVVPAVYVPPDAGTVRFP